MNSYDTSFDQAGIGAAAGILGGAFIFVMIAIIAICVLMLVSMWKIYAKAGRPGWAAIIPIYSTYVLFDVSWGKGIYFLASIIPAALLNLGIPVLSPIMGIVNLVVYVLTAVKLAKAFGKGAGYAIGLILLPVIFYPMLAFGSADYVGVEA